MEIDQNCSKLVIFCKICEIIYINYYFIVISIIYYIIFNFLVFFELFLKNIFINFNWK